MLSVDFPDEKHYSFRFNEFNNLARSLDVLFIVKALSLKLKKRHPAFFVSKGILERLRSSILKDNIGLVLIDSSLSPTQQRNLEKSINAKVLDRTGLVLEIFGSRAKTKEGVMQVELAHLIHQKTRLVRSWTHLERQRGGRGFLGGPGETQIESDRRSLAIKIGNVKKSIVKVRNTRQIQRNARIKNNIPLVSFVGYTNAGKSTLFNSFPNKRSKAENRLFSTLDPFMKKIFTNSKNFIISDTVGFINNLPPALIMAFRATLEEITHANLIVHVIDVSDEDAEAKAKIVYNTLETIGVSNNFENKVLEVHNKIEISDTEKKGSFLKNIKRDRVFRVSAKKNIGIEELSHGIEQFLFSETISEGITLHASEVDKIQWLYKNRLVNSSKLRGGDLELHVSWNSIQK
ncbi:GTPase HflX, partial [Paracoccaceae bacterium]|nr:GTPase HflX [Paracoccaceae bacterium]